MTNSPNAIAKLAATTFRRPEALLEALLKKHASLDSTVRTKIPEAKR